MRIDDFMSAGGLGNRSELIGNRGECRFPRYGLEPAFAFPPDAPQRRGQPDIRIAPFTIIAGGALFTQRAAAHGMAWIAAHLSDNAIALDDENAATVVTVARAGC